MTLLLSGASSVMATGNNGQGVGQGPVQAQEKLDCTATYSIQLKATYPTNDQGSPVGVKCNEEEYNEITGIIHSVVQLDTIMTMLGKSVPKFMVLYDHYGDTVEEVLETSKQAIEMLGVTQSELSQDHLTVEDKLENLKYEYEAEEVAEGTGRMLEAAMTPDIELLPLAEKDERALGAQAYCAGISSSCTADWCCWFCASLCKRRRNLRERELVSETEEESETEKTLREKADALIQKKMQMEKMQKEIDLLEAEYKGMTKEDELYKHRVEVFNKIVAKSIEVKLRKWARDTESMCLGNSWEIVVVFDKFHY